ncbi:MAG: YbjN domain-containing protein [Bacteroidota bacterium]
MIKVKPEIKANLELARIGGIFENLGFTTKTIEKNALVPFPILLLYFPESYSKGISEVGFSFIPITSENELSVKLLQMTTAFELELPSERKALLFEVLLAINTRTPLGSFSVNGNGELLFRYVHSMPTYQFIEEKPFLDTLNFFVHTIEAFLPLIKRLIKGNINREDALKQALEG